MIHNRTALTALVASTFLFTAACGSSATTVSAPSSVVAASPALEPGNANPMIAEGVTINADSTLYKSSGLGPKPLNSAAPASSPESFIDTELFAGGALPAGVTVTEAQGINALKQIRANLEDRGLRLTDVVSMRVFLDNPPGTDRADYAGWNRAYRQFFANTNLGSGDTELVPLGTGQPAAPLERNSARPSRFALEVASLPVPGWLVEVEVDAVYSGKTGPK